MAQAETTERTSGGQENMAFQAEVAKLWPETTTENLETVSDIAGYRAEFLRLFGFGMPGVDYKAEAEPVVGMPSAG